MSPDPARPYFPPPRVVNRRANPPVRVEAAITHGYPASRLAGIEEAWTPARAALAEERARQGRPLEHAHWNWTEIYRADAHDLFAIEANDAVQGLMAIDVRLRRSELDPGAWVLYVDFLEVAAWNSLSSAPTLLGEVGSLLIAEAVRVSLSRAQGRISLHSLSQSVGFYTRCGLTNLGTDPGYYDLVYFEYDERAGREWLKRMEGER